MTESGSSARLLAWFEKHRRDLPWRRSNDPYLVWISEVMLQQTRVDQAEPYYTRFVGRFPDVQSLAAADLDEVLLFWEGLGYYARARYLHRAAKIVVDRFGGRLPNGSVALQTLPGVGPYTAAAVASIAFGEPIACVDGNVSRVVARFFGIRSTYGTAAFRREIESGAALLQDRDRPGDFNEAMMELGATVCTPAGPKCPECPLQPECASRIPDVAMALPFRKPRKTRPHHQVAIAVIARRDGRLLIQRRPENGLLGGLWEFPGGKIEPMESAAEACIREIREELSVSLSLGAALPPIDHAYTHFSVTLHPFAARIATGRPRSRTGLPLLWVPRDELAGYAFPRANRRLINELGGPGVHWLNQPA